MSERKDREAETVEPVVTGPNGWLVRGRRVFLRDTESSLRTGENVCSCQITPSLIEWLADDHFSAGRFCYKESPFGP